VSDQTKLGLGKIITTEQQRDAIHIAIAPITVAHDMAPGTHVGLDSNGHATNRVEESIGVIDPFLESHALKGERCWLFLYPGTIKSLRHEWTHPAFTQEAPFNPSKAVSEEWMRKWAMAHMSGYYGGPKNEYDALAAAIRAGREHHVGPYEDARDYINDEWWNHWEIITGEKGDRDEYFSCGC